MGPNIRNVYIRSRQREVRIQEMKEAVWPQMSGDLFQAVENEEEVIKQGMQF